MSCRMSDVQKQYFYCDVSSFSVFENHSEMRHFLLVLRNNIFKMVIIHINWEVFDIILAKTFIELRKIMLNKLTEWVVIRRFFKISTFELIYRAWNARKIFLCYLFYSCHMLLLLKKLLYEFFILERSMVQRLYEVLSIDIFKCRQLVELLAQ